MDDQLDEAGKLKVAKILTTASLLCATLLLGVFIAWEVSVQKETVADAIRNVLERFGIWYALFAIGVGLLLIKKADR